LSFTARIVLPRGLALVVAYLAFAGVAATPAAADPGDIGYQGMHFSGTGTQVTGAKPESKLWHNDGFWWAAMWDEVGGDNFIFRLDAVSQTWTNTGVILDNRSGTRADVLWDGTKLFVASHSYVNTAQSSTSGGRLYRYSYNATTDKYTLDTGFPVSINGWRTESLVIAKDSTGRLWATWNQGTTIMVNRSTIGGTSWGTPFALPVADATGITTDDISSIIAFGGNKIGVMWSDQTRAAFHFAIHADGAATGTWTKETALAGPLMADDHVNLKTDSSGRVYAAVKTSRTEATAPLVQLLVREAAGSWSSHVFGRKTDHHTRPIVVLDASHGVIHMFATSGEEGGTIYTKRAEIGNIVFEEGLGTPVVRDADSADVNDVTTTKQNVTTAMGLVVQASDDHTLHYWHNWVSLTPLPLKAEFSGSPTRGPAPLAVAFTDQSTGDPTGWSWNFGDGATSTAQNPTHTYSLPGTYTVTLTVTDAFGGTNTKTRTSYITAEPLAAEFTGSPTSGPAPHAVTFTDQSTGNAVAWLWDFGDGATSTTRNPAHTYSTPGTYTVTLTITGFTGLTSTKTRTGYITALPLTADFTGSPTSGPAPHAVTFTDTSIGTPTSWSWDFGDGGTSTAENPAHTYTAAGTYTVTLTVTDAAGATSTKTRAAYITALPLTADFTVAPVFGAVPLVANFTDTSIGTPTSWSWNFGDGAASNLENPTHTYSTPGTYTVTLTVTDSTGATSTKTQTDVVTASPDAVFPAAADSYVNSNSPDRNFGAAGSVRVRDGSTTPPHYVSYLKFNVSGLGDSVSAAKLRLHVTDAALDGGTVYLVDNAWTEMGINWTNAPLVTGTPLATIGDPGDVGSWAEISLPASAFAAGNGTYSLAIKSNNPSGGAVWYSSREGVGVAKLVLRLTPLPLAADFTGTPTSGGVPLAANFTDTSAGTPTSWAWDFGDGGTSTARNPSHTYASPGTYTVTLTVTDASGGTSTKTRTGYVTVEPLAAEFTGSPTIGPAPLNVTFTDASTGDPTSWAWDFGDGGTSTAQNPAHTYANPGTYTVTLTVTDVHGATNTRTRTAYITSQPLTADFTASTTFGTAPLAVSFTDTSIGTPTTWAWDFGDGGTSTERNPAHTYSAAGTYTVTLTVADGTGATSTKTRTNYVTATGDQVFTSVADTFASSNEPDRNFGTATSVRVRSGTTSPPHYVSYLKFSVSGLGASVTGATLRLHVTDAATDGGGVYLVDNAWTETGPTGLTWNTAPAVTGTPLVSSVGSATLGTWITVELPASAFAAGNGTYSLAIKSNNSSGGTVWYSSREGVGAPQLILRTN
jgi:PKD repeat protein